MTDPELGSAQDLAQLGAHLADLASTMAGADGAAVDLQRVLALVSRSLPRAGFCGLTLVREDRPLVSVAATDEGAHRVVDRLQQETGQGPVWDLVAAVETLRSEDLRVEARWPQFGIRCADEIGVRSLLSVGLPLAGRDRATLSVFSTEPRAFGESDERVVNAFVPFAALALQQELHLRDVENLQAALSHSRRIGTAIGIVMTRRLVGAEEAFDLLSLTSQHLNRKLRDIAAEVVETGDLPTS